MLSYIRFQYTKQQYFILVHLVVQELTVLIKMREASWFQNT